MSTSGYPAGSAVRISTLSAVLIGFIHRCALNVARGGVDGVLGAGAATAKWLRTRSNRLLIDFTAAQLRTLRVQLGSVVHAQESRIPWLSADPDVRFALDVLMPSRLEDACNNLRPNAVRAANGFSDFTRMLAAMAIEGGREAETAEDVAAVVIDTLDTLQDYLIAHRMITRRYLLRQEPGALLPARKLDPDTLRRGIWDAHTAEMSEPSVELHLDVSGAARSTHGRRSWPSADELHVEGQAAAHGSAASGEGVFVS